MLKLENAQPFLKWAGGKRQLIPILEEYLPSNYERYFEPFVGAGAMLFHLKPKEVYINDMNEELINAYQVIKDNVEELIKLLGNYPNEKDFFYQLRDLDRTNEYKKLTHVEKAARIIFLNKTCFNGLYRVNSKGQFNVSFGKYKNPSIVNEETLRKVHHFLNERKVHFSTGDFSSIVLKNARMGDFIYFDPPYDPVSTTSSFTSYSSNGFGRDKQEQLKEVFRELDKRGCFVMLSNSSTDFMKGLYSDYNVNLVKATRNINSNGNKRGKINEIVVTNYDQKRCCLAKTI